MFKVHEALQPPVPRPTGDPPLQSCLVDRVRHQEQGSQVLQVKRTLPYILYSHQEQGSAVLQVKRTLLYTLYSQQEQGSAVSYVQRTLHNTAITNVEAVFQIQGTL